MNKLPGFWGQYLYNIILGIDQMVNVLLLGDPDESLSGRTGRAMQSGKPKRFIPLFAKFVDWLFLVIFKEKNHVLNAIEPEERPKEKELWSWIKED